jgi:hypothetical protein
MILLTLPLQEGVPTYRYGDHREGALLLQRVEEQSDKQLMKKYS